jgi:hemolysin III
MNISQREEAYPLAEERVNAAIHGLAALLGLAGTVFLIVQANADGRAGALPAVIVYGAALVLLFAFSTLQHAISRPSIKLVYASLDHCGIFLLIAGTYTPFYLLLPPGQARVLLVVIWGVAAVGMGVQVTAFLAGRAADYERFAFLFYLAMGWLPILLAGTELLRALAPLGLALLVAGGLAYSVGVAFYLWKRLPFGHAVWHLFVVAGSAFHFFAILLYVIPERA